MGWSNYIIVKDWKFIIETNREVDELEDYIKESLDRMIDDDTGFDISTSDLKVSDITVKDLCTMASAYENASSMMYMNPDKLFLYWLESRGVEYEIKSEYNLELKKYKEDGYNIISRWESDEDNDGNNEENNGGNNDCNNVDDKDSKQDESGN